MSTEHKKFINQLFMLIKTAQIHSPGNQAFQIPLDHFRNVTKSIIDAEGAIVLEVVDVNLYLNETKVRSDISTFGTFRFLDGEFERMDVGGLRILREPTAEEISSFINVFIKTSRTNIGHENLNNELDAFGVEAIEFIRRTQRTSIAKTDENRTRSQKRSALKNYVKTIDVVKNSVAGGKDSMKTEARKAKRLVYNLVDICLEEGFSFLGLSNIKNYDEYTFNHSVNVCVISIGFGKNLGLSKRQIGELGIAGLYHDYGKLTIPREILNKPGKFDPDEWEIMKSHPLASVKRLLNMENFQEIDIKKMIAAFEHHRNYDCSGYPETGIKKPMNFLSRVVAIADAYDAMTTNRVYQRAMLPTIALKILVDNAGTKFDPLLVKAFVNTIGIYPVGTLVRLESGTLGVVSAVHKDPKILEYPVIKLVADAVGGRMDQGPEVNLAEKMDDPSMRIATVLRPEEYGINVSSVLFGDVASEAAA